MKVFMQGKNPRLVWNPKINKIGVQFIEKEFQTDDKELIDLLVKAGYAESPSSENKQVLEKSIPKRTKRNN